MIEVYKITNDFDKRYYIGVHKINDNNYYGSGLIIRRLIKKYGKKHFMKQTLDVFETFDEAFKHEKKIINKYLNDFNCVNIAEGGRGGPLFKGKRHSIKTKLTISSKSKGRKMTKEARQKISKANSTRKVTTEMRVNLSNAMRKAHLNPEYGKKISKSLKKYYKLKQISVMANTVGS